MVLGMPVEYFVHEVARVLVYAALATACVTQWRAGAWARVGAVAGAVGAALSAFYLGSYVAAVNGHGWLADLRGELALERVLYWTDLLVLGGLCAAVALGRGGLGRRGGESTEARAADLSYVPE